MTGTTSQLADALILARRERRLIAYEPTMGPADLAEAVTAQSEVARALDASVAGWKVGYAPDGTPIASPLYKDLMHRRGDTLKVGPSGKSGIEVEIALRLGKDLPPRPGKPYDRREIVDATAAVLLGVEIVESRFSEPPKPPFLAALADNSANGAYVSGPETTDFLGLDLVSLRITLSIDGRVVHQAVGGHAKGDPLTPVVDYASSPCDMLGGLKAGQIITTGTLNGCPYIEGAHRITARIEGLGLLEFSIEP